jgi:hypothetical protein
MAFNSPMTPPLLFGVMDSQDRTPRTGQSPGRGESTSLSRRSLTPGSVTTDNTPPRAPPRERLSSLLITGEVVGTWTHTPGPQLCDVWSTHQLRWCSRPPADNTHT